MTGHAMFGTRWRESESVCWQVMKTELAVWVSAQTAWHFARVVGTAHSGFVFYLISCYWEKCVDSPSLQVWAWCVYLTEVLHYLFTYPFFTTHRPYHPYPSHRENSLISPTSFPFPWNRYLPSYMITLFFPYDPPSTTREWPQSQSLQVIPIALFFKRVTTVWLLLLVVYIYLAILAASGFCLNFFFSA